ncbi:Transglycosylase SLT domain-containing protein [Pedococcus dokdonensis]|uniref:Transglycosylase SLT domain-containing protein n=1 Tax=Pedococcus dokdonensis TaxID=443156 RepID=A0A1H0L5R3_9MICO|nr:lytic murein transglycosylase [Pedococcus dokdonensis]SDO63422.1 Transglycosylase SLT domain-containing protein [Pedococcus dokdonensis]
MHHTGAAVLAAASVLLSASTSPHLGPVSGTPAPEPSRTALGTAVPDRVSFDDLAPAQTTSLDGSAVSPTTQVGPRKPSRPPRGGAHGSWPAAGTPQAVLASAYRKAVAKAPKGCHLRIEQLAAIGQVESGSIGGRSVTSGHRVTPAIYGPLLDGGPFAVIHDSDGGSYDGDGRYDRAMGPLQFLPGTWRWAGRDGDGDGRRDPQNVFDAALATAGYLCLGGRDLSRDADLRSAVLSYNQSDEYHSAVVEWVSYFRQHGLAALTTVAFRVGSGGRASDLPVPEDDRAKEKDEEKDTEKAAPATKPPREQSATSTAPAAAPSSAPTPSVPPPPTTVPPTQPAPQPSTPAPATTTPPAAPTTPPDPEPSPSAEGDHLLGR